MKDPYYVLSQWMAQGRGRHWREWLLQGLLVASGFVSYSELEPAHSKQSADMTCAYLGSNHETRRSSRGLHSMFR